MDIREEFERVLQGMEWSEVLETVEAVVMEMLGYTPLPPSLPPAPLPPAVSTEVMFDTHPQEKQVLQPGHLHSQAAAHSQGQHNNVPVVRLAEGFQENLVPIGIMNGEVVYSLPLVSAAPPPNTSSSQKRKRDSQEDDGRPYIKKPPNAFMIFRDEQRPKVTAELNDNNSATLNTVLGQRWKSLSKEEQAKYYEQAEKERRLHAQRHPDWSCSQNYGKKRKRVRRKAPTRAEASECEPEEVTQQVKRLCVTTAVTEPSTSLHPKSTHCVKSGLRSLLL